MRKLMVVAATAVLLGGVGGVATEQGASAGTGRMFTATEHDTVTTAVDLGKPGFDQGDSFTWSGDMLTRSGRQIGITGGQCIVVTVKSKYSGVYHCVGEYRFSGSAIAVSGFYEPGLTTHQLLAIVGGTGRYAGARGVLDFVITNAAKDTYAEVFRLF